MHRYLLQLRYLYFLRNQPWRCIMHVAVKARDVSPSVLYNSFLSCLHLVAGIGSFSKAAPTPFRSACAVLSGGPDRFCLRLGEPNLFERERRSFRSLRRICNCMWARSVPGMQCHDSLVWKAQIACDSFGPAWTTV